MTKNIERLKNKLSNLIEKKADEWREIETYSIPWEEFVAQAILDAGFVHIDNVGVDISEIKKKALYVIANHYNEPVNKIFVDEFIDAVVKAKIIKVKDEK